MHGQQNVKIRHVCLHGRLSAWNNSTPAGHVFTKFCIGVVTENLLRKVKSHYDLKRIKGILHENLCTFMKISRSVLHTMRNFSDKFVKIIKTHIFVHYISIRKSRPSLHNQTGHRSQHNTALTFRTTKTKIQIYS